ncbi:hypothetical protein ACFY1V_26395 [Streptomyces sp. NPDC001255]|uniref:hypothetical protein n=2 Tax=unclassified Streptomyces TaxID=2593676 RepID=UPI0036B4886C
MTDQLHSPVPAEPKAEPATTEPATTMPALAEPASAEPASAEPASAEPASAEPALAEPASAGPALAEPSAELSAVSAEREDERTTEAVEPPATPRIPLRERRGPRAAVRWGLAVVLCAGLAGGSAAYVTSLHRADVPGLSTKSDGRWDYSELSLPALRTDEPKPGDRANTAGTHFADPRDLLLPAPAGAKTDKALPGGVVPVDRFVAEYGKDDRAKLRDALDVTGLRQVTARGWTMPDGTHARVYLLRFPGAGYAASFLGEDLGARAQAPAIEPRGSSLSARDPGWEPFPAAYEAGSGMAYAEEAPFGARQIRHGYLRMGDTVALVITDHPGRTPAVPFRQMMILQGQLLA